MSKKALNHLLKSSEDAAQGQVHHVLLVVLPDGRLRINGSDDLVTRFKDVYDIAHVTETLVSSVAKDRNVSPVGLVDFPLLPCSPFGPHWEKMNTHKVRAILTNMLMSSGYTRLGRRKSNGMGECPPGWPSNIKAWDK